MYPLIQNSINFFEHHNCRLKFLVMIWSRLWLWNIIYLGFCLGLSLIQFQIWSQFINWFWFLSLAKLCGLKRISKSVTLTQRLTPNMVRSLMLTCAGGRSAAYLQFYKSPAHALAFKYCLVKNHELLSCQHSASCLQTIKTLKSKCFIPAWGTCL